MRPAAIALLLFALLAPSRADAQEASSVEARVAVAIGTGIVASLGSWVLTAPHGGMWHDEIQMERPAAWLSAIAIGALAGTVTGLTAPAGADPLEIQALITFAPLAYLIFALPIRGLMSIGADSCDEACHKLMLGLPPVLLTIAGAIVGAVMQAEEGPPTTMMMGPLTVRF